MKNIFKHFQFFIDSKKLTVTPKSLKIYYTVAKNLRNFLLINSEFDSINALNTMRFMRMFNQYLYERYGAGHIKRHLSYMKAFVIFLANDEIIEYNKIRDYTHVLPREVKDIVSLSAIQVNEIENIAIKDRKFFKIRNLFLIQCYTGLSYADLMNIDKSNVQQHHDKYYLVGSRTKSNVEYVIPLSQKARCLLDLYAYKLPNISNQKYNVYLKELAIMTGIDINLTTHVGRRTCGQLFLDLGYSIEAVSRILGHADIKTTQKHYAQSSFELVHREHLKIAM